MPGEAALQVRARVGGASAPRARLDVNLEFGAGVTAIVGPSGAGKTTLLTAITGLVTPDAGRIVLGTDVLFDSDRRTSVPPYRRRTALVFQSLALFPHLLAWENVAYGMPHGRAAQRRSQALHWLDEVRAAHLAERKPGSLSGGEAQRVAVARALASEPRVLLLDEPFSALDTVLRDELGAALRQLVLDLGIVALLVTHHREDAARLCSRVVVLAEGRVVDEGCVRPSS